MIPKQVEGPKLNSTKIQRPKLTGSSQWVMTLVTLLVCIPFIFSAANLRSILENAQCPISTFYSHWIFMGSSGLTFGLVTVAICPILIMTYGANALKLLQYEPPYKPSSFARRAWLGVTAVAMISLAAGYAALIDDGDRFFCMSPEGIMVRRGLKDTVHHYSWSDVRTMYVSCLILHLSKKALFPAAHVSLDLRNGEQLLFGLQAGDERTLMSMKANLTNINYKFYVNRTVTPEYCPANLYEYIWNWLSE